MIYLILAILSSAMVSVMMRFSEAHVKNKMSMFMANYAVCLLLARAFMGRTQLFLMQSEMTVPVLLGLISGVLYLVSFVFLQKNMQLNGVVMSSTFMKLGVIVPTLMAILVFREMPTLLQIIGVFAAIGAIIVIHFEKEAEGKSGRKSWLLLLLVLSGITDSMANIYDKTGSAARKEHYLFFTFLAALLLTIVRMLRAKERPGKSDLIFGVLIGIPNYLSARFLLLALANVPAVVTYPVYSVATIVVISLAGVLIFKETISSRKKAALLMIMVALVMLNL